jgi:2-polyprenyl-3-methyl-5-hydroxy-6-metoxy-1,4-benzoquinol methylase
LSFRDKYKNTVADYYSQNGNTYSNPHEKALTTCIKHSITKWQPDLSNVLDLACGSGEVTLVLRELNATTITGIDPFTQAAYLARTGQTAEPHTFAQIAAGSLAERRYSLVVCSYALHLAEVSRLPQLMIALSQITNTFIIYSPHKKPIINSQLWQLKDELVIERVHARIFTRNIQHLTT